MGPLLIHNKNIKLMDSILRTVAEKRYESEMEKAHKILFELFEKQPDIHFDKKKKEKRFVRNSFKVQSPLQPLTSFQLQHKKVRRTSLPFIQNRQEGVRDVRLLDQLDMAP